MKNNLAKVRVIEMGIQVLTSECISERLDMPRVGIVAFYSSMKNAGGINHTLTRYVEGAS